MVVKKKASVSNLLRGFTLIELLVAITIMGVMTSISSVSITNSRNQRKVQAAAEQVRDAIIEAHAYAIAPQNLSTVTAIDSIKVMIAPKLGNNTQTLKVTEDPLSGEQVIIDKGFSKDIKITCAGVGSDDICLEFNTTDSNKIGQIYLSRIITVENMAGTEKYKLTTDAKTGSVKMEKM